MVLEGKVEMDIENASDLLSLVKQRNDLFLKFRNNNDKELEQVRDGNFSNLKQFYDKRSSLLKSVGKLDAIIRGFSKKQPNPKPVEKNIRTELINALDKKESLIKEILEQDLEIIHLVDEHQLNESKKDKVA